MKQRFEDLQFDLPTEPFITYLEHLIKWNQAFNLTAIRDPLHMVSHHILDSLAIRPFIHGKRLLDVGTGAGFPGIPLAIAKPELEVVLLDCNGKKIQFLKEIKRILRLDNVEIVQSRAETYHCLKTFDTVTSRALCNLANLIDWTSHLLSEQGSFIAMKGQLPTEELMAIKKPYLIEKYTVPGIDGNRCCIIINNQ